MTSLESIESDPIQRSELNAIAGLEVVQRVLLAMKDSVPTDDVSGDPTASVRELSRRAGYHEALDKFISLTNPPPEPTPEIGEPTWGAPE